MKYFILKPMLNLLVLFLLLASLLGNPAWVTSAYAAGFTVTKVADTADGACNADCSLREAIIAANAIAGTDIISLPPGTYTLTRSGANENASATGDLDITSAITINGTGKGNHIVQAGTSAGAGIDRVFHVVSGTLVLNTVTIKNGRAPNGANGATCGSIGPCPSTSNGHVGQDGGGILNAGVLSLSHVSLTDNWAGTGGKAGNLTCTLIGPQCKSKGGDGGNGGGIFSTGTLTIAASTFSGNRAGNGGAAGSITCASSCQSTPGIGGSGGGIVNGGTAPATITTSIFTGNSGDTGLACSPGSSHCLAFGGAVLNKQGGTLTVTNSTFSGNSASFGGAVDNEGTLTVIGSTFSGNSATTSGGAIFNNDTFTIANSTFLDNISDNGGLFNSDNVTMTVTNATFKDSDFFNGGISILNLFNNILTSANADIDCFNAGSGTNKNNLVKSTSSSACGLTNAVNGNIVGPDPNLGALTGAPAFFPLLVGSLAINTGDDAKCAAAPVSNKSQNGLTRPQGAHCDIGSFELDVIPPTVLSSVRANPNPTAAASVAFTVTFSEAVSGVDATDFSVTTSGITGASITSVSGSGALRTVNVNTGTGSGGLRLDVLDDNTIIDAASNPLNGGLTTTGQVYTIDKTPPSIVSDICINTGGPTPASLTFRVVFDEAVTAADPADFSLTVVGVSGASITGVSGSGAVRNVTVNSGSGNGSIRLDLPASATIKDASGNALAGLPFITGTPCTVDKTITLTLNSIGANDGFVLESAEAANVGGSINNTTIPFNLGDDAANRQFRAILHFDTSSLPDTASLLSATLKIKRHSLVGTDPFTTHGDLRVELNSPFFGTSAALELADFQAAFDAAAATFNPTPVDVVYSASFNAAGLSHISRTGPTQLRLRFLTDDDNDLEADVIRFFSGDATTIADRPQLVIKFILP